MDREEFIRTLCSFIGERGNVSEFYTKILTAFDELKHEKEMAEGYAAMNLERIRELEADVEFCKICYAITNQSMWNNVESSIKAEQRVEELEAENERLQEELRGTKGALNIWRKRAESAEPDVISYEYLYEKEKSRADTAERWLTHYKASNELAVKRCDEAEEWLDKIVAPAIEAMNRPTGWGLTQFTAAHEHECWKAICDYLGQEAQPKCKHSNLYISLEDGIFKCIQCGLESNKASDFA